MASSLVHVNFGKRFLSFAYDFQRHREEIPRVKLALKNQREETHQLINQSTCFCLLREFSRLVFASILLLILTPILQVMLLEFNDLHAVTTAQPAFSPPPDFFYPPCCPRALGSLLFPAGFSIPVPLRAFYLPFTFGPSLPLANGLLRGGLAGLTCPPSLVCIYHHPHCVLGVSFW